MKENCNNLPDEIEEFLSKNPKAFNKSLYLLRVVDREGNIVESKIGMNLVTNYGLSNTFTTYSDKIDGASSGYHMWLGNGCSSAGATIDPSSSSLVSYISALGVNTSKFSYNDEDNNNNTIKQVYPLEYDSVTKNICQRVRFSQFMWDYTAGSNQEYEINEFGISNTNNNTNLTVHGLIYDENGDKSSITKRPNTRLYITPFHAFIMNSDMIKNLYDNNVYYMGNPCVAYNMKHTYSSNSAYGVVRPIVCENIWGDYYNAAPYVNIGQTVFTKEDNDRVVVEPVAGLKNSSYSFFFDDNISYAMGFMFARNTNHDMYKPDCVYGRNGDIYEDWFMFVPNELPVSGYNNIKNIECDNVYVNTTAYMFPYNENSDTNLNNLDILIFSNAFGMRQDSNFTHARGVIPTGQFSVSDVYLYNHTSNEWDISVSFSDAPDTYFNYMGWNNCLHTFIRYNDINRHVYVFVNMYPQYKIIRFNNTNKTVIATDAWWDVSTYDAGLISNINSIPAELQQKRYYVVISGGYGSLNPIFDLTSRPLHTIDPPINPFELTANNCPTNISRYWKDSYSSLNLRQDYGYTMAWPLFSQTYGFFLTQEDLIYYDLENQSLTTSYKLKMNDGTQMSPIRRWLTEDNDRIIGIHGYQMYSTDSSSTVTYTDHVSKDVIRIWTVGDDATTPTSTDIEIIFSTDDNNTTIPLYSFSEKGFLVEQRNDTNEVAIVDIYGVTNNDTPTFYLLSNTKHCRCLSQTTYCVYQNMTASHDNVYTFDVYDMSTQTVVKSFSIDNSNSYTITGIFGWKDYVYIQATSSTSTNVVFLFDISNNALTLTDMTFSKYLSTDDYLQQRGIISCDECLVASGDHKDTRLFTLDDPAHCKTITKYNSYREYHDLSYGIIMPVISYTHSGTHMIFAGITQSGELGVVELGLVLDKNENYAKPNQGIIKIIPDYTPYHSEIEPTANGSFAILNNGIVFVDSLNSNTRRNRIYYVPIESLSRMKVIGTTKHINSYNAPVKFYGTTIQHRFTNDLSKITNQT